MTSRIWSVALLALGLSTAVGLVPQVAHAEKIALAAAPVALPHWFPIYVAKAKFFKEEGLDADFVGLGSGTAQVAAVLSRSVQAGPMSLDHIAESYVAGGDLVAVASLFNVHPNSLVLSQSAIDKAGIKPDMPLVDKLKRLRGMRIGITGPGGAADVDFRTMLKVNGLDADQLLRLQPLGEPNAMFAAFQKGVVDGFMMSAPIDDMAETKNIGRIVVDPFANVIPELAGVPYSGLVTTRRELQEHPEVIRAAVRAITKAIKYIHDDPEGTRAIFRDELKGFDSATVDKIIAKYATGSAQTPVISEAQYRKIIEWSNAGRDKPIDAPFAAVVFNDFAIEAAKSILGSDTK